LADETVGTVEGLWRYPVKSMQGEAIEESVVGSRGLAGDRAYALYDPESNRIASAKRPRVWGRLFEFGASLVEAGDPPRVRVTFPDGTFAETGEDGLEARLSEEFGMEVRVLSAPPEGARYMSVPLGESEGEATAEFPVMNGFFDLAVMHLLTTGTLEHLSALYPEGRFAARRYRPNVLVRTPESARGFVENAWVGRTLALGEEVRVRVFTPAPRCVMTTLPQPERDGQAALPNDPGILRAAAANNQNNVGVYAIVERGGVVRRGDRVSVDSG
jgi:uncharacterized protein YcbX